MSVVCRFLQGLRTNSPAPKSSRKLSATCAATKAFAQERDPPVRQRRRRIPSTSSIDPCCSRAAPQQAEHDSVTSCHTNVNVRMRRSGVAYQRGCCWESARSARVSAPPDSAMATAPPINDSSPLSVRIWRTSCRAVRSQRKSNGDLPLAHERARDQQFATFAHEISSTSRPSPSARSAQGEVIAQRE